MKVKPAGREYIAMDHYTRVVYTGPLRLKLEELETFKVFKAVAENEYQETMRDIMTDNARLCMGEMKDICEQERIKLLTSVRYSAESNGVAERTIRVLTNAVRAMLHVSGLTRRRTYIIGCQRRHWAVVRDLRSVSPRNGPFTCIRRRQNE